MTDNPSVLEFSSTHDACIEGVEWCADKGHTSMRDVWLDESLPHEYRTWIFTQKGVVDDKTLRLFACWSARLVLTESSDPRSLHAVDVAERYAHGEASKDELSAAYEAARAAYAAAYRAAHATTFVSPRAAAGEIAHAAAYAAVAEAAAAAADGVVDAAAYSAAASAAYAAAGKASAAAAAAAAAADEVDVHAARTASVAAHEAACAAQCNRRLEVAPDLFT